MGKGSELVRRLEERPLGPGEGRPLRPELRVRPDAPSVEVDNTTPVETVLDRLGEESGVVVRDQTGVAMAVVLPPERYAELAGCEVESEQYFRAGDDGIAPDPEALGKLMIEKVDPAAAWNLGSRIWREPGQSQ